MFAVVALGACATAGFGGRASWGAVVACGTEAGAVTGGKPGFAAVAGGGARLAIGYSSAPGAKEANVAGGAIRGRRVQLVRV